MSSYDESGSVDQAAAQGEFANGLISEGDYQCCAASSTVEVGNPNKKPRCAFSINLYQGNVLVLTHTMYQGLNPAQPDSLRITEEMLTALGAVDPFADISDALRRNASQAVLRGLDSGKMCKARVKHDHYEGKWSLKVSIFGSAFKDQIEGADAQNLAAQLAGYKKTQAQRPASPQRMQPGGGSFQPRPQQGR